MLKYFTNEIKTHHVNYSLGKDDAGCCTPVEVNSIFPFLSRRIFWQFNNWM